MVVRISNAKRHVMCESTIFINGLYFCSLSSAYPWRWSLVECIRCKLTLSYEDFHDHGLRTPMISLFGGQYFNFSLPWVLQEDFGSYALSSCILWVGHDKLVCEWKTTIQYWSLILVLILLSTKFHKLCHVQMIHPNLLFTLKSNHLGRGWGRRSKHE